MLNRQAHDAIQRMVDGGLAHLMAEQRPILIHRRRHVRPLILYVLPIPMADSAMSQFLGQARVIVLAIDPEDAQPPDPSLIRDILGLTLGEARVASLVGTGVSPRDAAQKLGIAEETARSTLKRIFSKVGVSRQSELTALMSRFLLK
jgi:DNA-binding CsgD family transcriptional regulator